MRLYLLWWYDDVFYDGPILRWAGWDGPIIGGFCSFWRNRHRLIALHCCTILTIFRTVHNVSFVQLYICVDTLMHNKLSQFCPSINSLIYYRAIKDAPVSLDLGTTGLHSDLHCCIWLNLDWWNMQWDGAICGAAEWHCSALVVGAVCHTSSGWCAVLPDVRQRDLQTARRRWPTAAIIPRRQSRTLKTISEDILARQMQQYQGIVSDIVSSDRVELWSLFPHILSRVITLKPQSISCFWKPLFPVFLGRDVFLQSPKPAFIQLQTLQVSERHSFN